MLNRSKSELVFTFYVRILCHVSFRSYAGQIGESENDFKTKTTLHLVSVFMFGCPYGCKSILVCDEIMTFGMIICHAITNNYNYFYIGPSNISCIKVAMGFYPLLSKFSRKRKIFEPDNHFH